MPQAVVALAAIGQAVVVAVGSAALAGAVTGAGLVAIGAATVIAGGILASKLISSLYEMPEIDTDASRQRTVRGTVEPMKIIYGETLVSGPIAFVGTAGEKNRDLYHAVVLAGHEVAGISDIHFDNEVIFESEINSGNPDGGDVTSGVFGPKDNKTICKINKHLGGSGQVVDADLDAAFTAIGSNHIGTGLAYIVTKWTMIKASQETWDKYNPKDIKALVQGRKVYDYRLDDSLTKPSVNDASFIAYSSNPVWCLTDYLMNGSFGMAVNPNKIDWDSAVTAANVCDEIVTTPDGDEKRFTCNGVLFGTDNHKANINKILSSMNGMLTYTNGKYVIRAGAYEAPVVSLNEDHLNGGISLKTSVERSDRFNTITGTFIDPAQNYKSVEFQTVQIADALSRDNSEVLTKEINLPMTNSENMAQRLAYKLIKQSYLQQVLTFPANLAAVEVAVGDRVQISIDELGWSNKVFICLGWNFSDSGNGGVNLTLREDNSDAYADPEIADYTTPESLTLLPNSFYETPAPFNLAATAGITNITLEWDNPEMSRVLYVEVYASATEDWVDAKLIGTTNGTQFIHGGSNKVDPITATETRYYWVRARSYDFGTDTQSISDRYPNSDVSGILATAGSIPASSGVLAATVNNLFGFGSGPTSSGTVSTGNAVVEVTGGTSPYTYSWTHVSTISGNTPTVSSSTAPNPVFSATVQAIQSSVSTWKLTVTDDVSDTVEVYATVTLTWLDTTQGELQ